MRTVILLILSIVVLSSCDKNESKKSSIVISGSISNPRSGEINFQFEDVLIPDTLNDNGNFSISYESEEPIVIFFYYNGIGNNLYARPGDSIVFNFDASNFPASWMFEGDAADLNNYGVELAQIMDTIDINETILYDEDEFISSLEYIDSLKLAPLAELDDQEFIHLLTMTHKFSNYQLRLSYEQYHEMYKGLNPVDFEVSPGFYDFIHEIDLDDSTLVKIPAFIGYASALTDWLANNRLKTDAVSLLQAKLQVIDSVFNNPVVREKLLVQFFKFNYADADITSSKYMVDLWNEISPNAASDKMVRSLIEKKEKISPGQPAPEVAFENIEGGILTMEDFKGSIVYIDVWATWCGPCIQELPKLKELQDQFKDKKVVFLSVSIDDKKEPWISFVNERQLDGVHVYSPGGWGSEINEYYMINSIPRFILIDQNGNIVNASAARPSVSVAEEIEALLNPV